ncbi:MAG: hypothetical protein R3F30_00190 [Planctomycetota bacterium]
MSGRSEPRDHVLLLRPSALVPRPWGGDLLPRLKGVPVAGAEPIGESFECAAWPDDEEAARYPSLVERADGATARLVDLLAEDPEGLLGAGLAARHGPRYPLLPKLLDLRALLSVQAHPPGNPEAYVIIEAEDGATLRLGFREDTRAASLALLWKEARKVQEKLLEALPALPAARFVELGAALSRPTADALGLAGELCGGEPPPSVPPMLEVLLRAQRASLAMLHAVPAVPGRCLFNCGAGPDGGEAAEVHALGDPEGRRVLALEVRLPGPTHNAGTTPASRCAPSTSTRPSRSWPLRARTPESFVAAPAPVPGRPGVFRSATCAAFTVEHLRPTPAAAVAEPGLDRASTLHVVRGAVRVVAAGGELPLPLGASAFVPAGLGYEVAGEGEVVRAVPGLD